MGIVDSHCASYEFRRAEQLLTSGPLPCGGCERVCQSEQRRRLHAARAGLEALAGGTTSANLPTNERRLVEAAIDRWCGHLSAGSLMTVDERLLRVSLAAQPLALVVEQRGTFPLATMDHMDLRKACWSGHDCLLSFAAPCVDTSGKWPQVLRFTFLQHDDCAEFALAVRALQRLAPDMQDAFLLREPTGSNSNRSHISSVRSGSSAASGDRRGLGRSGKRNRRSSKQRPVLLTGAADSRLAALAVEGLYLPSRAEMQIIVGDETAPKPSDSPSAKTMKASLLDVMRIHSNNPTLLNPKSDEEVCSVPSAADSPSARKFKGGLAESLRVAALCDNIDPPATDSSDRLRSNMYANSGVPVASGSTNAVQCTLNRAPLLADEPPPLGHKFISEPLAGSLPSEDTAEVSAEQHATSGPGPSWRQFHQFRRARLAAIIGPCPQSERIAADPQTLTGQELVLVQ